MAQLQFLRISQRFCRIFAPWFVMWWNIPQALIWTGPNDMHFLFFEVWIDSNESTMWSQKSEAKHHNLNPTSYQNQIQICHIQLESKVSAKKRRSISCKISEDLDFDFLDMNTCGLFPHSGFNHDLKKDMSCFFRLGLLIEFDGLIDSEAIQMWQIFGAVQFFKVRSCTQDAVDICGLQER